MQPNGTANRAPRKIKIPRRPRYSNESIYRSLHERLRLRIEYVPVEKLKANPRNWRKHPPVQVRKIAKSMAGLGVVMPAVADRRSLQLWLGHGRWEAAKLLGLKELPVVFADHLTKAELQALAIADHSLVELALIDEELYAENLKELSGLDLSVSLDDIGIEPGRLDALLVGLERNASSDKADLLPSTSGPAVTKLGDFWDLELHRVGCADALDEASHRKLMNDRLASMVLSDSPWNVKVTGHIRRGGRIAYREFPMASGELSKGEFTDFLTRAFGNSAKFSERGSCHYQFIDFRHLDEMLAAGRKVYSGLLNVVIWAKPGGGGLGAFYKSAYEMIFVWRHGRGPTRNNVSNGRFGRDRTNLWSYPSPTRFGGAGEENDLVRLHPSPKPVQLMADAILDVTKRGEIVADPFLGSGSTLIAAQRTGRTCFGLELDPLHVDLVIRRWQRFTGLRARHSATGRYFDELEVEAARNEKRTADHR
jgi:hypothetical protein